MGKKEKTCYGRNKWISFDLNEINKVFRLSGKNDGSKFNKLKKYPDHQKIVELLTNGKGEWNANKKNPFNFIL